jgi:16S rRNA (cytosine967-C5)-methyltransferase
VSQSPPPAAPQSARQVAFQALRQISKGAFADVALDRVLHKDIPPIDRRLITELTYGTLRRQRSLDARIDNLASKPAHQQPADLRLILQLGLYQIHHLDQIPDSAAVNTTVDLAKQNGFPGLSGFVNGVLRQSVRQKGEEIPVPPNASEIETIGIRHSFPDWIVEVWRSQFSAEDTALLCQWMNKTPSIDLRVNLSKTTFESALNAFTEAGIAAEALPHVPAAIRLPHGVGSIQRLPGFIEGHWIVQDSSAQLVSYLLDPQPGETIIDACAAPGGKTLHIAELMQNQGTIHALDRTTSRLKKLTQNRDRLGFTNIQPQTLDSATDSTFVGKCDRLLIDAPCSGLGTVNRHADARWRQSPESVTELTALQQAILHNSAQWVKPGGVMVYATCTLHPEENERQMERFLSEHGEWAIDRPDPSSCVAAFMTEPGWVQVVPHQQEMDGFFMVRLKKA